MFNKNKRMGKFISFYKPYAGLFTADILSAVVVMAISLSLPLCTRYITKNILEAGIQDSARPILHVGFIMLLLIAVQAGCSFFCDYMGHVMGARMERDMRSKLFSHLQKLPLKFFDHEKTGQLMSRVTNDLLNISELCHHGPEDLIIYLLSFIGAFVILLQINSMLALAAFAIIPVMILYSLLFGKKLKKAYKHSREKIADINAQLEDSLAGIRVVKSFANETIEEEKFAQANNMFYLSRTNIYKNEAFYYTGLTAFFVPLMTVIIVVAGGIWISREYLDIADLIVFLLYIGYLTTPIPQLARVIQQYQDGIAGFNRFMDIIETPAENYDGKVALPDIKGNVEFKNVSFRYDKGAKNVLENLSLKVSAGEYMALVGTSGVGKTTLCSMIPRFYMADKGSILLDGHDISNIPLDELRKNIGVVHQDVYLFAGTVLDNILYGKPNASMEEVVEAAKKAYAHDFITELPNGYNTDIGQRGIRLSGGQRQRLSIARTFLKNPPILIFDEATSALDNESEKVIHQSLSDWSRERTTFVIAHRLSTIRKAKRIAVLTDKGIEEEGTHEELIAKNGVYAHLYNTFI